MKRTLIAFCILLLIGCSKSGGDSTKPVVAISTPTDNQQFNAFSSVTISGTVADNDLIHQVQVIVTNIANNSEVLHFQGNIGAKSYNINQVFTVQPATTYKIHIEADDSAGNISVLELHVKGN
jgi:hypothetical protein